MTMSNKIEINRNRVKAVVQVATHATASNVRELHPLEAIIGFAEVVGRAIAAQDVTTLGHQELIKIACQHIEATVKAAYVSKGMSASAIEV
jgi:hypothetical protein